MCKTKGMALEFPEIDPVALQLGSLVVRWYALAYLAGFVIGWQYCIIIAKKFAADIRPSAQDIDDFLSWAVAGVILGGRLGYVLFYNLSFYAENPIEIFKLWNGGMSFHGGMLGVIVAALWFSHRRKIEVLRLADVICVAAPIGLFFGRIANFINGEVYGRVTTLPMGVIFPHSGDGLPRHPSQLYEAFFEGLIIFIVLAILIFKFRLHVKTPGQIAGVFFLLYGIFRSAIEIFREPDSQIGLFFGSISMGQILCLPMIMLGLFLLIHARNRPFKVNVP